MKDKRTEIMQDVSTSAPEGVRPIPPFYNEIYNGDLIEAMSQMQTNSVDLVFSDPPYNKNKNYGIYKDNLPEEIYWRWVTDFIDEYKRISNNKMAIFIGSDLIKGYWTLMPDAKLIIVRKGAIGTPFKDYFRQYFGLLVTAKPTKQIYDLWTDVRMPGEGYYFREERFPNPGLTSLTLTRRVISYFTNEMDIIFDGFMGTGTTAVASLSLGRNYGGAEINEKYIDIANQRIINAQKQMQIFETKAV